MDQSQNDTNDTNLTHGPTSPSTRTSMESHHSEETRSFASSHQPPPFSTANTITTTALLSTIQGDDTNEPQPSLEAENDLRRKILDIQRDTSIPAKDKARQIQQLMWQGSRPVPISQASSSSTSSPSQALNPVISEGVGVSYHDEKQGILGCPHYQRKCKLQAYCCNQIYSCRFCHDEASDHTIVRSDTKNMYCMLCQTLQPAAQICGGCQQQVARYFCDKCKLWDDDSEKSIYHCDDCGICRQGKGLGEDFFHCHKCNICMSISMQNKHRCIERNLESDCPICGEYMFTSTTTVIFMPCGHCIHKNCYTEYIQTSYQCPTCLKSLGDMSDYFARLDRELERQSMPAEYAKYISHVFCNDCELRSPAKYHFFYHKCAHCSSYNTTVLRTENTDTNASTGVPLNLETETATATTSSSLATDTSNATESTSSLNTTEAPQRPLETMPGQYISVDQPPPASLHASENANPPSPSLSSLPSGDNHVNDSGAAPSSRRSD